MSVPVITDHQLTFDFPPIPDSTKKLLEQWVDYANALAARPTYYNPETCLTASELRNLGFPVPSEIPDGAWVPKWAIRIEPIPGEAEQSQEQLTLNWEVNFDTAFRLDYITVNVQVEPKEPPSR